MQLENLLAAITWSRSSFFANVKYNTGDIFKTVLCELQRTAIFLQVEHSPLYVMWNDAFSKVSKCHNTVVHKSITDVWRQQHRAWKKVCRISYYGFLSFPITNEWTFMKSPLNLHLVQLHDQVTCQMYKMLCSSCSKEMLQKTWRHTQLCCYLIRIKTDMIRYTVRHVFSTYHVDPSSSDCSEPWLMHYPICTNTKNFDHELLDAKTTPKSKSTIWLCFVTAEIFITKPTEWPVVQLLC